jgi:hypothetical protein
VVYPIVLRNPGVPVNVDIVPSTAYGSAWIARYATRRLYTMVCIGVPIMVTSKISKLGKAINPWIVASATHLDLDLGPHVCCSSGLRVYDVER